MFDKIGLAFRKHGQVSSAMRLHCLHRDTSAPGSQSEEPLACWLLFAHRRIAVIAGGETLEVYNARWRWSLCRANTGLLTKELRSARGAPGPSLCHSEMTLEPPELPCCVSQGTLAQQTRSGHKQDQTSNQEPPCSTHGSGTICPGCAKGLGGESSWVTPRGWWRTQLSPAER